MIVGDPLHSSGEETARPIAAEFYVERQLHLFFSGKHPAPFSHSVPNSSLKRSMRDASRELLRNTDRV
jgi:hypothetical protein